MVHGKSLEEVLLALSKYEKPLGERRQGKKTYPFYKISQYEKRLMSVLGIEHFNVSYTEPKIISINSGQEIMNINCRITILDDDFRPIFYKEGCGSKELLYTTDTGRYDGSSNLAHNASTSAFKSACKALSLFGETNDDNEFSKSANEKPTAETADNSSIFSVDTPPEVVRMNANKPVYKLIAKKATRDGLSKPCEIIFYPNQYSKCTEFMNELIMLDAPRQIRICASPCGDGSSYVFKGL